MVLSHSLLLDRQWRYLVFLYELLSDSLHARVGLIAVCPSPFSLLGNAPGIRMIKLLQIISHSQTQLWVPSEASCETWTEMSFFPISDAHNLFVKLSTMHSILIKVMKCNVSSNCFWWSLCERMASSRIPDRSKYPSLPLDRKMVLKQLHACYRWLSQTLIHL